MPTKHTHKRYTLRQAEALLARLVAFADRPIQKVPTSATRRLLLDVLHQGPVIAVGDMHHEIMGTAPAEIRPWAAGQFAGFQRKLRRFFRDVVQIQRSDAGGQVPAWHVGALEFGAMPVDSTILFTVDGDAAAVLAFQVRTLLEHTGISRLQQCACGRAYVKTGRREFCSNRCQKRIYMRNKRKQERDLQERRQHGKSTRQR